MAFPFPKLTISRAHLGRYHRGGGLEITLAWGGDEYHTNDKTGINFTLKWWKPR